MTHGSDTYLHSYGVSRAGTQTHSCFDPWWASNPHRGLELTPVGPALLHSPPRLSTTKQTSPAPCPSQFTGRPYPQVMSPSPHSCDGTHPAGIRGASPKTHQRTRRSSQLLRSCYPDGSSESRGQGAPRGTRPGAGAQNTQTADVRRGTFAPNPRAAAPGNAGCSRAPRYAAQSPACRQPGCRRVPVQHSDLLGPRPSPDADDPRTRQLTPPARGPPRLRSQPGAPLLPRRTVRPSCRRPGTDRCGHYSDGAPRAEHRHLGPDSRSTGRSGPGPAASPRATPRRRRCRSRPSPAAEAAAAPAPPPEGSKAGGAQLKGR